MINLTTMCRNIATVLTLSVLLINTASGQDSGSVFQSMPHLEPVDGMLYPELGSPTESQQTIPQVPDDLSILTRGPLHEAFASAHQANPQSSELISKAPPEPIDEVAPDFKPEGNNVQWIPGYWAWDDSQSDFIWISGIWRDVPPNRRWVPGYWSAEGNGHRWVSGFWAEETQQELGYIPAPPASLDQGPSTIAPGEEHFYVPGNWQFQDNSYRWGPGHWHPIVEDWIWVPSRYVWTPNGCVYQSGYWDYEFQNRGTCFAPVHFTEPVYLANNYSYRPSYAINLNVDFLTHLFVRPGFGHYFYGDWYASNFNNIGYRPWVSFNSHFRSYDPLLAYYGGRRSSFDSRYNVVQYLTRQHNFYANNRDYRPRPTYTAQFKHAKKIQNRHGSRSLGRDYIHKSNYVRSYKDLRGELAGTGARFTISNAQRGNRPVSTHSQRNVAFKSGAIDRSGSRPNQSRNRQQQSREAQQIKQAQQKQAAIRAQRAKQQNDRRAQQQQASRRAQQDSARIAQQAQRNRAQQDQARRVQQDNNRRAQQQVARNTASRNSSGKQRLQNIPSIQQREQAARRAQQDSARRAQQDQARRAQQDQARRTQQDQARRAQQANARRAQEESARRAQQRKTQQDNARRAQQDRARKTQQANARKAQQDKARRAQQDQARKAQQANARRAQQENARRAQQQASRKAQQDRARRAQQDRSRQQAAQRAKQQKAQRDSARKAQQAAQRSAAKRSAAKRSQSSKSGNRSKSKKK